MKYPILFFIPITRSEYLEKTITSVIQQTTQKYEVLFLDNSFNEEVYNIVQKYTKNDSRFRYIKTPRKLGVNDPTENWNYGLNYIDAKYYCLLGDDDTIATNYLEEMMKLIDQYPGHYIYRSRVTTIDSEDNIIRIGLTLPLYECWDEYMYFRNVYSRTQSTSELVISTQKIKEIGGYLPAPYAIGSDDITYLHLMVDKPIISTNFTNAYWRRHGTNLSMLIPHKTRIKAMNIFIERELEVIKENNPKYIPYDVLRKSIINKRKGHVFIKRIIFVMYRYRLTRIIILWLNNKGIITSL